MKRFLQLGLAMMVVSGFCIASDAPSYKLAGRYPVPGNGGFDYIFFDGSSNRLYVSHGTEVDVVNADSGALLGKIEDTLGVHGIAIAPRLHRGFTSNGKSATVSVFDTNTLQTLSKIPVPPDPDFILYDPRSNRILVNHGDAAAITAIDPETAEVIGSIDLGGGAEASVLDGKGRGFVNLESSATMASFDPVSLTVKSKWPIPGCRAPTGLAIDAANSRLFIGCRSKVLAVMDANNGNVITTLPIGERVDAVVFDADSQLIFASNGEGTISVIHQMSPTEYASVGDIQTQKSAKTMAFDPKTKRLFLSAAEMETAVPADGQKPRAHPKPGTFAVLVVAPE